MGTWYNTIIIILKIKGVPMNKVYNTYQDISNSFRTFLSNICPFLPKTALNIMPEVLTSMLDSTSCITKNIALSCKGNKFDSIQFESVSKRIKRFFNNTNYNPYQIYDALIKHVLSKYTLKHSDNRVHIVFDHMYEREQFVTFMISMRIGKKSIPLWYRCFKGGHHSSEAFQEDTLKKGIKYVSDLFKDKPNYKLIFLADRWFNSTTLLDFIDSLGHTYVVRASCQPRVLYFNKKEHHKIKSNIGKLFHYKYKATYYENVEITKKNFKTNIVISAISSLSISKNNDDEHLEEPWYLLTNGDMKRAIKDYGYRFSAIEFLFKDQKSNGFNLEKTATKNIQAFTMMYTCVNICILYLTCLSTYYTRHKNKLYKDVKIKYYSTIKGKHVRKISIFQVGLILFKRAMNSLKRITLPFNFVLTDV